MSCFLCDVQLGHVDKLDSLKICNVIQGNFYGDFLGAIFWIARTGSLWRDLPEEFGKCSRRLAPRYDRIQKAISASFTSVRFAGGSEACHMI